MTKLAKFLQKYGIYFLISICLMLGLSALLFKNATMDDDLYLLETTMMTEAFSRGEWIGNYAVGTHGFLFKLPVAIIFLLTGPSLAIATVWNILLACLSLYLFYTILKKLFSNTIYPLLGALLLLCNFQFILNLPTYMREFPVLLSVLFLIYVIVYKKSYWVVGLALLLILDAKEYVLPMILPAILVYILQIKWNGFSFKTIWEYVTTYFKIFLPTILFLLLMIFTSVIPLNMYTLSLIPNITKGGIEYQIKHFETDIATTNKIDKLAPSIQEDIKVGDSFLEKSYKSVLNYAGKFLYPRSFSFLSIPKVLFFPAFLTSFFLFRKKKKEKDSAYIFLSLILWSFIAVFIARASFDRYLFPILPVVIFFFLLFLKDLVKNKRQFIIVLVITSIFALVGLLFEVDYIGIKIVLNVVILLAFILYLLFYRKLKDLKIYLVMLVSGITFSVVAYFFYANGQLHQYLLWGHDYQIREIVGYFKDNERVLLNDVGWDILVKVYRGDNRYNPEWKWELQEWVPRKKNLKMFEKLTSYGMSGESIAMDKAVVLGNNIEKVGLMVSTLPEESLKYQERLEDYLNADWLELTEIINLKNKQLYIFRVLK